MRMRKPTNELKKRYASGIRIRYISLVNIANFACIFSTQGVNEYVNVSSRAMFRHERPTLCRINKRFLSKQDMSRLIEELRVNSG